MAKKTIPYKEDLHERLTDPRYSADFLEVLLMEEGEEGWIETLKLGVRDVIYALSLAAVTDETRKIAALEEERDNAYAVAVEIARYLDESDPGPTLEDVLSKLRNIVLRHLHEKPHGCMTERQHRFFDGRANRQIAQLEAEVAELKRKLEASEAILGPIRQLGEHFNGLFFGTTKPKEE